MIVLVCFLMVSRHRITAYLSITVLLPLCNQHCISIAVLAQPLVQLLRYLILLVQLPDVFRALMRDLKDRPHDLVSWNICRWQVLGVLHLVGEDEEGVLDVAEAGWRRLALGSVADSGHDCV